MSKRNSLLGLIPSFGNSLKERKYLADFAKRLVENPGAVTVYDINIASSMIKVVPEDLFLMALCWSELDAELEKQEWEPDDA